MTSATSPFVIPNPFTMVRAETWPLGFDATPLLAMGDTISGPSSVLLDTTLDQPVTLGNVPTVSGNVITQVVVGSTLTAQHSYLLSVTFTANTDKIVTMPLQINVPF